MLGLGNNLLNSGAAALLQSPPWPEGLVTDGLINYYISPNVESAGDGIVEELTSTVWPIYQSDTNFELSKSQGYISVTSGHYCKVNASQSASLCPAGDFTMSFWYYPSSTTTTNKTFFRANHEPDDATPATGNIGGIEINTGLMSADAPWFVAYSYGVAVADIAIPITTLTLDTWHSITVIYDSTANTMKVYVVVGGGVDTVTLYGQDTSTGGDFNTPYDYTLDVGAGGVAGIDVGFGGLKVYNRILSNSELISNYDAESSYYSTSPI